MRTTNTPWLSILLPIYNVSAYLEACLRSIAEQDLDGVQIVAVDDCSTDGSLQLLERLQRDLLPGMEIVRHEVNQGLSLTRNTGIAHAVGKHIWFVDSDDVMARGAVAELRQIVRRHDPDLVICDFSVLHGKPKLGAWLHRDFHRRTFRGPSRRLRDDPHELLYGLFRTGWMHSWTKISKRSLWHAELRFPRGRAFQDIYVTPLLAMEARTYWYEPRVWIHYRQRADSIQATLKPKSIIDFTESMVGFRDAYAKRFAPTRPDTRLAISHAAAGIFVLCCAHVRRERGDADLQVFARNFQASVSASWDELLAHYLRTLQWRRYLKLRHWVKSAGLPPARQQRTFQQA